jgi:Flp pilus assembly protein TadD
VLCYKKGIEFNNDCADVHYHYGILLLDNDNLSEALFQFNKALRIRPSDSKYLVCKGICLKLLGKPVAAQKAITDALSFDEKNADAWFQLGKLNGVELDKIKYFDRCLALNPTHSGAFCSKGASLSNIGQMEEALVYFEKGMTYCRTVNAKDCNTVQGNLGKTKYKLYKTGKNEYKSVHREAAEHFKNAVTSSGKDEDIGELMNDIGYIYLAIGNIPEAKRWLNKAHEQKRAGSKHETVVLYNLGLTYLLEGNYREANEVLARVVRLCERMKSSERKCYCLYIPEVKESKISLVEVWSSPDIYECAKAAVNVTQLVNKGIETHSE